MRLLRVDDAGEPELHNERGQCVRDVNLYADDATGLVYALTPEERNALDPLWREDVPESA
jgi:hypothetical protein